MAELWLRAAWERSLLIWHFLSLQSNHMGLSLSSLNPLQTLTHNDPLLNMSLLTPSCPAALSTTAELAASKWEQPGNFSCPTLLKQLSVLQLLPGSAWLHRHRAQPDPASLSFTHTQTTTAHQEAPGSSKVISCSKWKAWVLNNTAADV